MNSLLGGLGNAIMNMQKATPMAAATQMPKMPNILMQAMGAALRHEDPHEFLSNLQQTASQVCQQNGVDMQSAINQIDNITSSIT